MIATWAQRPGISARSVLVTIFGDTVLPVTNTFWLSQLFSLTEVFGFSQRLVRTSMFRLSTDGWFTSQRVGRQSQYTATQLAIEEVDQASHRIYGPIEYDWRATPWTLVILDPAATAAERTRLGDHLKWNGFFRLGTDLLGSPTVAPDDAKRLAATGSATPTMRAVATANFEDLEALLADGFFTHGFDTEAMQLGYKEVVEDYRAISNRLASLNSFEAFAFRTMLVHDLRRIKLRYPELPASFHGPDWIGREAHKIARESYPQLSRRAAPALSELLQVDYPSSFAERFAR